MTAIAAEQQAHKKGSALALETHEALQAAQAEVSRLEGRRVALFGDFRAAAQDGDGPAMVRLREEWLALPLLLAGAKVRMQLATLAHLEPQIAPAQQALQEAERGLEQARDRLPYARGDLPNTNQSLIDGFSAARSRYERAQAAVSVLTGGLERARNELARLRMIRLD